MSRSPHRKRPPTMSRNCSHSSHPTHQKTAAQGACRIMIVRTLLLTLALITAGAGTALAAERMAYEPKAFTRALEEGRPILVHVTAPWCGECRAQKPIVAALAGTPAFKGLTI